MVQAGERNNSGALEKKEKDNQYNFKMAMVITICLVNTALQDHKIQDTQKKKH